MFAPARLLIAVDFSRPSAAALRAGLDLAARCGAQPHILHVVSRLAALPPEVESLYSERERAERRRLLRNAEADLRDFMDAEHARGEGHVAAVASGHPATAALDYAAEHDVGLVVVGTHGRRGVRRWLLGSVASEVLHHAEAPVLVVPEPTATPGRSGSGDDAAPSFAPGLERSNGLGKRGVLAPTDLSPASRLALPIASALADLYGAPLDLLYALEPVPYLTPTMDLEIVGDLFGELRDRAEGELVRAATALRSPRERAGDLSADGQDGEPATQEASPPSVRVHVESGRAADVVVSTARELGARFIVVAKHGRGPVARLTLGSVTERVCREAPCPVLVLPSQ